MSLIICWKPPQRSQLSVVQRKGVNEPWVRKTAGVGPGHFVKPLFSPPHPRLRWACMEWRINQSIRKCVRPSPLQHQAKPEGAARVRFSLRAAQTAAPSPRGKWTPKKQPVQPEGQVSRREQRNRGRGQVTGDHTSWKQLGARGRQRRVGTSGLTWNHAFWVISVLETGKESWRKTEISYILMQPVAQFAVITIKLALQTRSKLPWRSFHNLLTLSLRGQAE